MPPTEPTSWLLNGREDGEGWSSATTPAPQVTHRDPSGLRLMLDRVGPLSLSAAPDSLGGLVIPQRMAFDDDWTLYLLVPEELAIKRFNPEAKREDQWFQNIPHIGNPQADVGGFTEPNSIAIVGACIYVVDPAARRVQVFDLRTQTLVHCWTAPDRTCWADSSHHSTADAEPPAWEPFDVAAHDGAAWILDRRQRRVFRHLPGTDLLQRVDGTSPPGHDEESAGEVQWQRITFDSGGTMYLLVRTEPQVNNELGDDPYLQSYVRLGRDPLKWYLQRQSIRDPDRVRDRFVPPAIRMDLWKPSRPAPPSEQRFHLPASLMRLCSRAPQDPPIPLNDPMLVGARRPGGASLGRVFDLTGRPVQVDTAEQVGPPVYLRSGSWYSKPLDSHIANCQWHRFELELSRLPSGSRIRVYTLTDNEELPADFIQVRQPESTARTLPASLPESHWRLAHEMIAGPQQGFPAGCQGVPSDPSERFCEFLVQSGPGRYLWLRIEMDCDGYETPGIKSIRLHYPRESWLQYLPAVYSADDQSREFLERLLSAFQTDWDQLERLVDEFAIYLDPRTVPGGDFMTYLARWLAVPLEGSWNAEQNRRLLTAVPELYAARGTGESRRGTVASLRKLLRVYLGNITGLPQDKLGEFPVIVEGFCQRRYLQLAMQERSRLDGSLPLWSRSLIGRLQLDVFSQLGEVRLISTGDFNSEAFDSKAHHFHVFLPSAWIRTADDEQMICRAIDSEKPAHTTYTLSLVEATSRLGVNSTLGVDAVMGSATSKPLGAADDPAVPRRGRDGPRLGTESVLKESDSPAMAGCPQPPRMGIDTFPTPACKDPTS